MYQQNPEPSQPYQPTGPVYLPPTPPAPAKKDPPRWAVALVLLLMAGCVVGVVAVVATSIGDDDDSEGDGRSATEILQEQIAEQPPLQRAVSACAPNQPGVQVGDAGHSVSIDGAGLADGPDIIHAACVLQQIDVPDSVLSRIDNTRALDGTQTAEWDDYWASWTYHPDDGLNMVIEQR